MHNSYRRKNSLQFWATSVIFLKSKQSPNTKIRSIWSPWLTFLVLWHRCPRNGLFVSALIISFLEKKQKKLTYVCTLIKFSLHSRYLEDFFLSKRSSLLIIKLHFFRLVSTQLQPKLLCLHCCLYIISFSFTFSFSFSLLSLPPSLSPILLFLSYSTLAKLGSVLLVGASDLS